ncbi:hypothetical protein Ancab_037885 [Ancistrocladus abbreviatus]
MLASCTPSKITISQVGIALSVVYASRGRSIKIFEFIWDGRGKDNQEEDRLGNREGEDKQEEGRLGGDNQQQDSQGEKDNHILGVEDIQLEEGLPGLCVTYTVQKELP